MYTDGKGHKGYLIDYGSSFFYLLASKERFKSVYEGVPFSYLPTSTSRALKYSFDYYEGYLYYPVDKTDVTFFDTNKVFIGEF